MTKLSENFTLEELTHSDTAKANFIDNIPDYYETTQLINLAVNVLQPIRYAYRKPVTVNSGYRNQELNKLVGGKPTSQHTKGQAADFKIQHVDLKDIATFIRDTLEYDQLILESYGPLSNSGWLHISYNKGHNRMEVWTQQGGIYTKQLPN